MYTRLLPRANLFRLSLWAWRRSEALSYPQRFSQIPNPICSAHSPESYSTYALGKASAVSLYFSQWRLPGPERAEGLTTLSGVGKKCSCTEKFQGEGEKKMYVVISICAQDLIAYIEHLPWNPNHLHSNSSVADLLWGGNEGQENTLRTETRVRRSVIQWSGWFSPVLVNHCYQCNIECMWVYSPPWVSALCASKQVSHWTSMNKRRDDVVIIRLKGVTFIIVLVGGVPWDFFLFFFFF